MPLLDVTRSLTHNEKVVYDGLCKATLLLQQQVYADTQKKKTTEEFPFEQANIPLNDVKQLENIALLLKDIVYGLTQLFKGMERGQLYEGEYQKKIAKRKETIRLFQEMMRNLECDYEIATIIQHNRALAENYRTKLHYHGTGDVVQDFLHALQQVYAEVGTIEHVKATQLQAYAITFGA